MTDNLDDLQSRIQTLKHETQPLPPESDASMSEQDKRGLGAAYELIMTPIVCGLMGVGLDKLLSTQPIFFITLAILGLMAGFWRMYRLSQNIQTPLDLKRLHPEEKTGRKAQISENHTE